MNVRFVAFALAVSAIAPGTPSAAASSALVGKMRIDNYLLRGKWTCTAAGSSYGADYVLGPGNTIHGHLYTAQSSEDVYYGYRETTHRFWSANADSTGATESQTSVDGVTYDGVLDDGKTTSKATNVMRQVNARTWTVRARGELGGHPYDFVATCVRT